MAAKPTVVLIASPGHSGQSWLCMLIGSHSNAVAVGEISEIFGRSDLRNFCSLCEGHCEFWGKFNEAWIPKKGIFSQLSDFSNKQVISVSKIGNFKGYLHTEDINIKVIRLIRDGRAFLASNLRKYPNQPVHKIVSMWQHVSDGLDQWVESFPIQDRMTLRYEDIVEDVAHSLKKVCAFLEVDYEPSMLEYWKVKHHVIGVNRGTLSFVKRYFCFEVKNIGKFYSRQEPSNFRDERWHRELESEQLQIFENVGGELNRRYGYQLRRNVQSVNNVTNMDSHTITAFEVIYPKPDSSSQLVSNAAVIIRSSGERTEALCRKLIGEQVPEKHITLIRGEKPFSKALSHTFEVGLDYNLPWTIAVDADLLVAQNAIVSMVSIAEDSPDNVFEINAQMLDKLFGGPKDGGLHLYRTSLLGLALKQIPAEGFAIRPESFVIDRMSSLGYSQVKDDIVVVIHDYEQFYRDVYRKAFFHGKKHKDFVIQALLPLWKRLSSKDKDYQVALWGFRASQIGNSEIGADVSIFDKEVDVLLRAYGLSAKDALAADALSAVDVTKTIMKFEPTSEYLRFFSMTHKGRQSAKKVKSDMTDSMRWQHRIRQKIKRIGVVRSAPWIAGRALERVGSKICSWVERT